MSNELSIGHFSGETGTVSGVFIHNGRRYILGSGHVLAPDGAQLGDYVVTPSREDSGIQIPKKVGRLSYFSHLQQGSHYPNIIDIAIAEVVADISFTEIDVDNFRFTNHNEHVYFIGRTSGECHGYVVDSSTNRYMRIGGRYYGFKFQIQTNCQSHGGDSGSLLKNEANEIIGIVNGRSVLGAVAIPFFYIQKAINQELNF
jgi:S1-C subfamily serine protease